MYVVILITIYLTNLVVSQSGISLKPVILPLKLDNSRFRQKYLPEIANLNFTSIARKFGYDVEDNEVITEDGYILTLFHITGNEDKQPVFMMHGLLDSADTFIVRGNTSIALAAHEAGFDVWVGNSRGNRYSRRHKSLNPDKDVKYWDFSFHEIGYYDCSAFIDYILNKTDKRRLSVVAHSQGTTDMFVLTSTRTEYNNKIDVFVSVAPAVFFLNVVKPLVHVFEAHELINNLFIAAGQEEISGDGSLMRSLLEIFCILSSPYRTCLRGLILPLAGSYNGEQEVEPEFLAALIGHYPSTASRKNLVHFGQLWKSKNFQHFDYGVKNNLVEYNSSQPPLYDLNKVTAKTAIFYGKNDGLVSYLDVNTLKKSLPNEVVYRGWKWSHLDFIWGRNRHKRFIPEVIRVLQKYRST